MTATLRTYQQEGVATLVKMAKEYGGALLGDDMGLGKTAQAVVAANELRGDGRVLIVCPASVRHQWVAEIERFLTSSAVNLGPPSDKKFKPSWDGLAAGPSKWAVVSYNLAEKAFDQYKPKVLVLDEAHALKGRTNPQAVMLREACRMTAYRLLVTGTPVWSYPADLWNLLNMAGGYKISMKARDFDLKYCNGREGAWGWLNDGATNLEDLKQRVAKIMVRRTKGEVLTELAELTRQVRWVQPKKGSHAAKVWEAAIVTGTQDAMWKAIEATLDEKIDEAVDLCLQARQFVCFTHLRKHADEIAMRINKRGLTCYAIHGDYPAARRSEIVARAQQEGTGIVATLKSCGTGVNLQGLASTGVMHALDWIPAELLQGEARIHRMGQKNAVTWTYLALQNSVDERIVERVVNRLDTLRLTVETSGDGSQELRDALDNKGSAVSLDSLFAEIMEAA